ncbi:hypothetical protein ACQRC6_01170 [Peptoniphilus sp. SGI.035]|uniref:hypothetical protein n=1 Tax=Peptoniphilus sp. SGI.035 TaxID=3420564 RepID=UPI003D026C75
MILDVCCGSQMFYFDKNRDDLITMDIRKENFEIHGKKVNVNPQIIGDFTNIPFKNETFHHVIFDPPHLISPGKNSIMGAQYGGLNKDTWPVIIKKGFEECMRVLMPNGTLVFKWSEHDITLKKVLDICPFKPVYGHRRGKTVWMIFIKC